MPKESCLNSQGTIAESTTSFAVPESSLVQRRYFANVATIESSLAKFSQTNVETLIERSGIKFFTTDALALILTAPLTTWSLYIAYQAEPVALLWVGLSILGMFTLRLGPIR